MTDTYLFVQANSYGINYINKRGLLRCSSEWIGQCHMPGWSEEQTMMTSTLFCLQTSGQVVVRAKNPKVTLWHYSHPSKMKNRHKPGPIRQLALLLALLLFSSSSALAYDCCIDGIYYNLNTTDKTASVTDNDNNRYSGDVVIPETIAYNNAIYSVTSIGESAFDYCSRLTSVVIPNSVTTIDYKAFANCSGLTSVTIPNSVTAIGGWAFINCTRLSSVSFNAEKCIKMGYRKDVQGVYFVFAGCTSLTTLTIGDKVTTIPSNAFRKCSALTSVTIGNSVTSIGFNAFYDCSKLTSVTIPNSVTHIGDEAFSGCSKLTSVIFNAEKCIEIGLPIFKNCTSLSCLTIGDKVSIIPKLSFYNFTSLVVDRNNGKYDSRDNCNAIIETSTNELIKGCKSTLIPNSVTSIGESAFAYCSGLTSVTIPNSVTSIGESAFAYCSGLTSVTIPNSVTTIGDSAFSGCSGLTSVTIPNSVTSIGGGAFFGCSGLTSVTIPNSVTTIGDGAFRNCSGLTSVTIGNSVTTIGDFAFCFCSGLTSVTIGNSVTTIGDYAFGGCSGLTSVTIPNSVTSIGEFAFQSCSGLTSVSIPNFVTSIGEYAFFHCPGLTSVTIGNSVTSIGDRAFSGCSGLTKLVSLAVEPPTCDNGIFKEVDKTTCQLLVPEESINKYKTADQWKEFLNILGYNGVDDVSVDSQNAVYEVYNLQGVRVGGGMREEEVTADVLPHGVYILVSPQSRKKLKI